MLFFLGVLRKILRQAKSIIEMPEVDSLWVGPVSGDGSLGVGGCMVIFFR